MNLLQWLASTIAVLTLIVMMGRAAKWMLVRGAFDNAAARQMAQWRVSPDASVRAVRIFDEVHLVLETRKQSSTLRSMDLAEFEALTAAQPSSKASGILELLPRRRERSAAAVSAR